MTEATRRSVILEVSFLNVSEPLIGYRGPLSFGVRATSGEHTFIAYLTKEQSYIGQLGLPYRLVA